GVLVNGIRRLDVIADVRNGNQQSPTLQWCFFSTDIGRQAIDRIIEITRVFTVDGDEGQITEVYPTLEIVGPYQGSQGIIACHGGFRELMLYVKLSYCNLDLHARIVYFTHVFSHTAKVMGMPRGLLHVLYRDNMTMFGLAPFGRRNKDVVFDALVF